MTSLVDMVVDFQRDLTPSQAEALRLIIAAVREEERARIKGALEVLAELEHEQWEAWSRTIAQQGLTPERIARWEKTWVPYNELDDATQEYDRVWARLVIARIFAAIRADE